MASIGVNIDPNVVPPDSGNFDLIPSGTIAIAHIIESDVKATTTGGKMIEATWEILDGPYAKRRVWDRINILNASAKAQEIGQRHWSAICVASGMGAVQDSAQVHYKPCTIKIGIEKGKDNYPDKNKVSGVKAIGAGPVAVPGAPAARPAAPPAQWWATPPASRPATPQPGGVPWGGQAAGQANNAGSPAAQAPANPNAAPF